VEAEIAEGVERIAAYCAAVKAEMAVGALATYGMADSHDLGWVHQAAFLLAPYSMRTCPEAYRCWVHVVASDLDEVAYVAVDPWVKVPCYYGEARGADRTGLPWADRAVAASVPA